MTSVNPLIAIGLVLSALAGFAAFLITYDEWSHHYPDKREPLRYGLEAGIVAFTVFAILTVLVSFFVTRLF